MPPACLAAPEVKPESTLPARQALQWLSDPVPLSSSMSPEKLPGPGTQSHHSQLLACKPRAVTLLYNYPANEKSE